MNMHYLLRDTRRHLYAWWLCSACCMWMAAAVARSDEGMWLLNDLPEQRLREKYNVVLSSEWRERVQGASLRVASAGSGAFVSKSGLLVTNYHIIAPFVGSIDAGGTNVTAHGYYAATPEQELPCPGLEIEVLDSLEDVTAQINELNTLAPKEGQKAVRLIETIRRIEAASLSASGLRSEVVPLFNGLRHHLHRYRRYTDVRIVFLPDQQAAYFGGDAANFEYPRHAFDVCFCRAYVDGKPANTPHYFSWKSESAQPGDLVFVSGHPGFTRRRVTACELQWIRDRESPWALNALHRLETAYEAFECRGVRQSQLRDIALFQIRNQRKYQHGVVDCLNDLRFLDESRTAEERARHQRSIAGGADHDARDPWTRTCDAQAQIDRAFQRYRLLELAEAFNSTYFLAARRLVRCAEEDSRPDGCRLYEYRTSARARLESELFASGETDPDWEAFKLTNSLEALAAALGPEDPVVRKILRGATPRDRAAQLVSSTRLNDSLFTTEQGDTRDIPVGAFKKKLYEGGRDAIESANDEMIDLAREVDAESRAARAAMEEGWEQLEQAHAEIDRLSLSGNHLELYPDAGFTLRVAYGVVRGYQESGVQVEAATTLRRLFEQAELAEGKSTEASSIWRRAYGTLRADTEFLGTHMNFVCNADTTAGNSGSPVIDVNGRLRGVVFDTNRYGRSREFMYTDEKARAIAVDAGGISEILTKVYNASRVVAELTASEKMPQ